MSHPCLEEVAVWAVVICEQNARRGCHDVGPPLQQANLTKAACAGRRMAFRLHRYTFTADAEVETARTNAGPGCKAESLSRLPRKDLQVVLRCPRH